MITIPEKLPHSIKYYIAESETLAISDWTKMEYAMSCLERFHQFRPEKLKTIKGVIKVDKDGARWVLKYASLSNDKQ